MIKICLNNKCIDETNKMEVINGGWSSWTDDEDSYLVEPGCRSTCANGNILQTRLCNNPK